MTCRYCDQPQVCVTDQDRIPVCLYHLENPHCPTCKQPTPNPDPASNPEGVSR